VIVAATGMAELVQFAGGWLFDHVLNGWNVVIAVTDHTYSAAVGIGGVPVVALDSELLSPQAGPRPREVAASMALSQSDPRLRAGLRSLLDDGETDIRLWGESPAHELGHPFTPVQHRLSVAALAFKATAWAAVSAQAEPIEIIERFHVRAHAAR
jgi:hypothetical protein